MVRRLRPLEEPDARVAFASVVWPPLAAGRFVAFVFGFAPLVTFAAELPTAGRLGLVMSLPIFLAATSVIVAAPAPAANPPATGTRALEATSDACLPVVPTRLITSPTAVAAMARVVSLSSTLRAPRGM